MGLKNVFGDLALDKTVLTVLYQIASLLKPLSQITGGGSNRLSVDVNTAGTVSAVTTVTTVTTVSNLTNMVNMGGVSSFDQAKALSRTAFNTGIRSKL